MAETAPKADMDPKPVKFGKAVVAPKEAKMHKFGKKFPDASGVTNPPPPKC